MIISVSEKEYRRYILQNAVPFFGFSTILEIFYLINFGFSWIMLVSYAFVFIVFIVLPLYDMPKRLQVSADMVTKTRDLVNRIAYTREVFCEGEAGLCKGRKFVSSGWMVLTEAGLEYHTFSEQANEGITEIYLDDILEFSVKGKSVVNKLIVVTKYQTYTFQVFKAPLWKEYIDRAKRGVDTSVAPMGGTSTVADEPVGQEVVLEKTQQANQTGHSDGTQTVNKTGFWRVSQNQFIIRIILSVVGIIYYFTMLGSSYSSLSSVIGGISVINLVVTWTCRRITVEKEKEEARNEAVLRMKAGTWEFPAEEFCEKCKKNNVTELSNEYCLQKAKAVAEQMLTDYGVPQEAYGQYLTQAALREYFLKGYALINQKQTAADAERLQEMRGKEREEERRLARFVHYHGREKRIAMIQVELDELNKRVKDLEELAHGYYKLAETCKATDGNWGLVGGIAEGLAGPAAGVAAAINAQQEAAVENQRNAILKLQYMEEGRRFHTEAINIKQGKVAELERKMEAAKVAVVADMSSTDVFNFLNITSDPGTITDTGAVRVNARIELRERINVFGEVKTVIDGALLATIYQNGNKVGTAKLVLPKEGVGDYETVEVEGIMLGAVPKGEPVTIEYAPIDLWIMEA